MPIDFSIILGIIQGLTEFLPISSSGHLVVAQLFLAKYFGGVKTPVSFDVLVHLATLIVVLVYMRKEVTSLLCAVISKNGKTVRAWRLCGLLIVGTLPAVIAVFLFGDFIESTFYSVPATAWGFIATACLLEIGNYKQRQVAKNGESITGDDDWQLPSVSQALLIGIAQAVAILPSVSRSGATISMALLLGVHSETALRFSFFLFIPAVLGAIVLDAKEIAQASGSDGVAYMAGFLAAAVFGWLSIKLLAYVVREAKLRVFSIYTLALGIILLFVS